MSGYSTFYSLEAVEAKRRERIYNISKRVYNFFSDDAPTKYGFEYRDGQIDMTCEIIDALMNRQHMVVEAGVGIGKSFAYLAPLLLYHAEFRSSVVVATSTIALQEQLSDDIEHLKKYLDTRVSVCLCKGQTHYICKTRAHEHLSRNRSELTRKISADIQNGAYDRRAFSYEIPQELWDEINVKKYNKHFCAKCVHRDQCGYHNLRGKMLANSSFILCNQDLLTAHLKKISIDSDGLLPSDTEIIVVDEVHNLESKVRSATTARISQHQILNIATVAANDVRGDGKYDVQDGLRSLKRDVKKLFAELSRQLNVQITKNPNESKYSERFFSKTPLQIEI